MGLACDWANAFELFKLVYSGSAGMGATEGGWLSCHVVMMILDV